MRANYKQSLLAVSLGALLSSGVAVQAATLPPVHKSGQIEYLSGGVGKDESRAIQAASENWPLMLEFAQKTATKHDEFVADAQVVVRDSKGHAELETKAAGPFMLARLAPGHYEVEATLAGKSLHQKVLVKHGHPTKAVFVWPAAAASMS